MGHWAVNTLDGAAGSALRFPNRGDVTRTKSGRSSSEFLPQQVRDMGWTGRTSENVDPRPVLSWIGVKT